MADEPHVIRGINWRETFPFTNIFRSFRIAIHPSKILLALVGLLLIYIGGRVLDGLWLDNHLAVSGEIALYQQSLDNDDPGRAFEQARKDARQRQGSPEATAQQHQQLTVPVMQVTDCPPTQT